MTHVFRRIAPALLLSACFPLAAAAQEGANEKAVLEKAERRLAEEMGRVRAALLQLVRAELGGTTTVPETGDSLGRAGALVTEELLKKHAAFLASDELEGRNAGYPGNDKATEYIAEIMKKAGLKPVGDKDDAGEPTYFQHFALGQKRTRNCLGLLEGTDPDLKKEIVVVGAHHDHVGTADQRHRGQLGTARGDDKIWNGADDNGSGTTCVLALIRAFSESGLRTKRSILFMTFSAEEAGLIGSRHYCRNPIAPIAQHVYMLNLDMVGRNGDKKVGIHGVGSAQGTIVRGAMERAVQKTGLKADVFDRVEFMGGDSDHSSFRDHGVPFTFVFTGIHADYHKVSDHADRLDYANMVRIARTCVLALKEIGDSEKSPKFQEFRLPRPGDQGKPRRTLGITVTSMEESEYDDLGLADEDGAIKIETVTADAPAAKAGIKPGDFVVSINGRKLRRRSALQDLRAVLERVEPGQEVPVEIIRGGEKMTVKAVWNE